MKVPVIDDLEVILEYMLLGESVPPPFTRRSVACLVIQNISSFSESIERDSNHDRNSYRRFDHEPRTERRRVVTCVVTKSPH